MLELDLARVTRRRAVALLGVVAAASVGLLRWGRGDHAGSIAPGPPDTSPPAPVRPGPWVFFTAPEGAAVEAIVDRLIPEDEVGPGGKAAGCAVFIDRQLAGAFGDSRDLYMRPPFATGTSSQGPQSPIVPKELYRVSLAALDDYCRTTFAGKAFPLLTQLQQNQVLSGLEHGEIELRVGDGKAFFEVVLANAIEGFFADPIYGGNRDMVGWKLVGFPGALYDYRDHIAKHNERYLLPPVSIVGRSEWSIGG